ncbi:Kelch motif family protein [Histomonas meleagridis]|uniref:Kelch motif family protein n=1 Tax=Histomonas meleagridis TaxID=135588 RepID=UPI00355AA455|nr:Kelch motif family protein [Histomonas meleagridis]KAH0804216.1 Kelch motif family protein [Histomonas meleagridis]
MEITSYVAFGRPSQSNIIKELKDIENKTTEEIAKDLKLENEFLSISTPLYREAIPPNSIPYLLFPEIAQKKRPYKFLRPKYFISILPESEKKLFTAFVLVQEKTVVGIPPFEVSFVPQDFQGKSFQDFFDFIISKFPFAMTDPSLLLDNNEIDPSTSASEIISCLKTQQLTFKCTLTDKELSKINHRVNIINEIQTTEITYLNGLDIIVKYWKPSMESSKLFTEDESNQVFHDFPIIINCHTQFLNDLKERGVTYGAMLSDVFLDFSSFFKVSLLYISNYSNIIKFILEKSKNKSFKDKLRELADKNPFIEGPKAELTSYLITPVQRMPRYILFLRELLKATPPSHPDFAMLESATTKLEEVTNQIDQASLSAKNSAKLLTIQNNFKDHYTLIHPSRIFISSTPITYKKPKSFIGILYLFNNLILFTKDFRNGTESCVYDELPNNFRYVIRPDSTEFTINIPVKKGSDKYYQLIFDFPDNEQMNEFIKKLDEIKEEFYNKKGIDVTKMFRFNLLIQNKSVPTLYGHKSITIDNTIYIFGGKSNNIYPTDLIVLTKSENSDAIQPQIIPTKIPGRINHSIASYKKTIYIFGGSTDWEYFNDLWEYNITTNNYQQLKTPNSPEARIGHTMTYYNNKLYIFGGINKKGKIIDDIWIFDIEINSWMHINNKTTTPSSRAFHTADLINDKIILHGGTNGRNKYRNDFAVYLPNKNEWENADIIGDNPPQRANHCSVSIKQFILFIGGSFGTNEITNPGILDTTIMKYINCISGMNDPSFLTYFSMNVLSEHGKKNLLIYGGCNMISKLFSYSFYFIEIPMYLKKILGHRKSKRKYLTVSGDLNKSHHISGTPVQVVRKGHRHKRSSKDGINSSTLRIVSKSSSALNEPDEMTQKLMKQRSCVDLNDIKNIELTETEKKVEENKGETNEEVKEVINEKKDEEAKEEIKENVSEETKEILEQPKAEETKEETKEANETPAKEIAEEIKETTEEVKEEPKEQTEETKEETIEETKEATEAPAKEIGEEIKESTEEVKEEIKEQTEETKEEIQETYEEIKEEVKEETKETTEEIKEQQEEETKETTEEVKEVQTEEETKEELKEQIEEETKQECKEDKIEETKEQIEKIKEEITGETKDEETKDMKEEEESKEEESKAYEAKEVKEEVKAEEEKSEETKEEESKVEEAKEAKEIKEETSEESKVEEAKEVKEEVKAEEETSEETKEEESKSEEAKEVEEETSEESKAEEAKEVKEEVKAEEETSEETKEEESKSEEAKEVEEETSEESKAEEAKEVEEEVKAEEEKSEETKEEESKVEEAKEAKEIKEETSEESKVEEAKEVEEEVKAEEETSEESKEEESKSEEAKEVEEETSEESKAEEAKVKEEEETSEESKEEESKTEEAKEVKEEMHTEDKVEESKEIKADEAKAEESKKDKVEEAKEIKVEETKEVKLEKVKEEATEEAKDKETKAEQSKEIKTEETKETKKESKAEETKAAKEDTTKESNVEKAKEDKHEEPAKVEEKKDSAKPIEKKPDRISPAPASSKSGAKSSFSFFQQLVSSQGHEQPPPPLKVVHAPAPSPVQQDAQRTSPEAKAQTAASATIDELCHELGLNLSSLAPFQVQVINRKLTQLIATRAKVSKMQSIMSEEIEKMREKSRGSGEWYDVYAKVCVTRQKVIIMRIRSDMDFDSVKEAIEEKIGIKINKLDVLCGNEIVDLNQFNLSFLMEDCNEKRIPHLTLYVA